MPRKVDPHWGDDGYGPDNSEEQRWPPFELSDANFANLAAMLDIEPASEAGQGLRSTIMDIGETYRRWHKRGAGAFTRDQARQALEELLEAATIDGAALTALNERALQYVYDSLLMMSPPPAGLGNSVVGALSENRIDDGALRQAVQDAYEQLKATRGPDRDGELAWAVAELCLVYEETMGQPVTHFNKLDRATYTDEPQSAAGRFVHACIKLIAPRTPPSRIGHALKLYMRHRNAKQNTAAGTHCSDRN